MDSYLLFTFPMPVPHLNRKRRGDVQLILEILEGKMIANRENCGKITLFQIWQKCLTPCERIVRAHAMALEVHDSDEGPPLCLGVPWPESSLKILLPLSRHWSSFYSLHSNIDAGYLRLWSWVSTCILSKIALFPFKIFYNIF